MASAEPKPANGRTPGWLGLFRTRETGILLSLLVIVLVIILSGPAARESFLKPANLQNLSRQIALLSVFAIGETFVIIAGGIDLSVGSLIAFSGVLTGLLTVNMGLPLAVALPVVLVVSALVGGVHAVLISRLTLQPFVATLGTMCILRGAALLLTDSLPIHRNELTCLAMAARWGPDTRLCHAGSGRGGGGGHAGHHLRQVHLRSGSNEAPRHSRG